MKTTTVLLLSVALIACNKNTNEEPKKNNLLLAENVWSILPIETDTVWSGSDLTNAANKFDREKLITSITHAVLAGKLKAYSNYPDQELSVKEVENILVSWDSSATTEDPNKPGTMITSAIKYELSVSSIPYLKFNEKIEMDTLTYSLSKKVSYATLYIYKSTETGETKGARKLFDVQFNDK
ncbi:MAG: hypothetical protein V4547_02110 [Bacteroidota bacterium]